LLEELFIIEVLGMPVSYERADTSVLHGVDQACGNRTKSNQIKTQLVEFLL